MLEADEGFLSRLPLPVAQLYLRGRNAKTPIERYLAAYYLWEASLKLLGSTAIVEYARLDEQDPAIEQRLQSLARPSTGHWLEYTRLLVPILADHGDEHFARIRDLLFGKRRDDLPRAAGLDALLTEQLEGRSTTRSTVKLAKLFDRLVAFRNRELGHGAAGQQNEQHYEKLGKVLLLALGEILQRLDVLAGRTLIHVAEVKRGSQGDWQVERYALRGETPRRMDSLRLPSGSEAQLPSPDHVYLEREEAASEELVAVHPLVLFEHDTVEVFFLNGRRGRKQADYLCYTTGNVVRKEGLERTQRELLSRVLGVKVDQEALNEWAEETHASDGEVSAEDSPERRTIGEFELVTRIGSGGMGEVFRAVQPSLNRQVALKCLLRAGDPKAEARFAREIRALGKVEHPNLIKIFTAGTSEDQWFYAMELIEGADLETICGILARGKLTVINRDSWSRALTTSFSLSRMGEQSVAEDVPHTPDEEDINTAELAAVEAFQGDLGRNHISAVVTYGQQIAHAAHALHEAGVVHRDIKPGNIMIDRFGKAVLMDLGLAKLGSDTDGLTQTRQFVGTLCYASPEQVLGSDTIDGRSDIYSIGATLWEMLTLRRPFTGEQETSTYELMLQIQQSDPEPVRKYNPEVHPDLQAIVLKCMEKNPEARYQNAFELAEDLGRFERGESVRARTVGPVERFIKRCRRRPALTGSVIAGAVLVLVGAGYLANEIRINRREAAEQVAQQEEERNERDANLSEFKDQLKQLQPKQLTPWHVAVTSYPGNGQTWWFDEERTAGRMLPIVRRRLAQLSLEKPNYEALFDSQQSAQFLQGLMASAKIEDDTGVRVVAAKPVATDQRQVIANHLDDITGRIQEHTSRYKAVAKAAQDSARGEILTMAKDVQQLRERLKQYGDNPEEQIKDVSRSAAALKEAKQCALAKSQYDTERETYAASHHTLALLQHRVATLHENAAQQLLHLSHLEPESERAGTIQDAANRFDAAEQALATAQSHYTSALAKDTGYEADSPLRALCSLDRVHLNSAQVHVLHSYNSFVRSRIHALERQRTGGVGDVLTSLRDKSQSLSEAAKSVQLEALPRLQQLNERLAAHSERWKDCPAFDSLRVLGLSAEGSAARLLAKRATDDAAASALFQQAESHFTAARDIAEALSASQPGNESFAAMRVETHVRLGLVFLDQWKFGDARNEFQTALRELEENVALRDDATLSECSTPQEFAARMEYLKLRHRLAMVQCYSDSLKTAARNFQEIIDEMTTFLESGDASERQRTVVLNQRANSLERCAECVKTVDEKLALLQAAVSAFTPADPSPAASVAYKSVIVAALDPQRVDEAARTLAGFEDSLSADTDSPLARVAGAVAKISEGDRSGAIQDLQSLLTSLTVTDRESIVTRLLAWQLYKTYSPDHEDTPFTELHSIVTEKTRGQFDLIYIDTYRDQVSP